MHARVLFICSGNFYRSRFAEAYWNYHAPRLGIAERAFSRGLTVKDQGDISPFTVSALGKLGIPLNLTAPEPVDLSSRCLEVATVRIAMKKDEHLPMIQEQFPDWVERVSYWQVHDVDVLPPEQGLSVLTEVLEKYMIDFRREQRKKPETSSSLFEG